MGKTYVIKTPNPSDVMAYFRAKTGLTKTEICRELGLSRPTLDEIEKRPSEIAVKYLDKLEKLYGSEFIDYYMDNKMYLS